MKSKPCLRCGGTCASYATQCIHCYQGFKQPYSEDKAENQKIVSLLTILRQGKSLEDITISLNDAGVARLGADCPWDKQSVAHVVHHYTVTGFEGDSDPTIALCQQCQAPFFSSSCSKCKDIVQPAKPTHRTPTGLIALVFNILVIGGLSLFIFYCKNYVTDGEGFNSNFAGFFLSVGATILAVITLFFGNIVFLVMAISTAPKRNIKGK